MHNWANEREFFADGSRGQSIYVHPPTKTIIIQLSEESEQDFHSAKLRTMSRARHIDIHALLSVSRSRPLNAGGADSAQAVFRKIIAEEREHPEGYYMNREGILGYAAGLKQEGQADRAALFFELARERYREYCSANPARCR
jgi:hypothetical protein